MAVQNDLNLVQRVVADLQETHFEVLLVGGWAEELHDVAQPRQHDDIDVVLLDAEIDAVDTFVGDRQEVVEKRLSQKRAYLADGVLVELFLARWDGTQYLTIWWGRLLWRWPADMAPTMIAGLPVASKAVLTGFRGELLRHHRCTSVVMLDLATQPPGRADTEMVQGAPVRE